MRGVLLLNGVGNSAEATDMLFTDVGLGSFIHLSPTRLFVEQVIFRLLFPPSGFAAGQQSNLHWDGQ
jgi:hypothetical protein